MIILSFLAVVEGLHEVAYKNALCNSLYCPDHMVGNIHSEHVSVFPEFIIQGYQFFITVLIQTLKPARNYCVYQFDAIAQKQLKGISQADCFTGCWLGNCLLTKLPKSESAVH